MTRYPRAHAHRADTAGASGARPFGYSVTGIEVRGCLHLKSAVTAASDRVLLVNPDWVDACALGLDDCTVIAVDPEEPAAANVLRAGSRVIAAASFPRTRARLVA